MGEYIASNRFKRFIPDWLTVLGLVITFFLVTERAHPFIRQFSLSDPSISHPFAKVERVTDNQLYVLSIFLPTAIVLAAVALNRLISSRFDKLHLIQVTSLGIWFSTCLAAVLTDILKCWIGNPRPDFLERCGAKYGTPKNKLVGIEVCTAPLGEMYLLDGMKSTPSGHSSMAFAGLLYLTLWLLGQYKVLHGKKQLWAPLLCCTPLVLASYIALSRTQDYRHHFRDVLLGSILGIVIAVGTYFKYFDSVFDEDSDKPIEYSEVE